jgi:hypothetical protein
VRFDACYGHEPVASLLEPFDNREPPDGLQHHGLKTAGRFQYLDETGPVEWIISTERRLVALVSSNATTQVAVSLAHVSSSGLSAGSRYPPASRVAATGRQTGKASFSNST